MSGRQPVARRSVDITRQQSWSEASPSDDRPVTPDLESQPKRDTPGWIRLAQEQQLDLRHVVAPRCTGIGWTCAMYRVRRVLRFWKEIQQKSLEGEDVEELLEKLAVEQDQYQRLILQTSQILAIDQPNEYFLDHLLPSWSTLLGPEDDDIFSDEMKSDWVSLSQPQKLDQMIGRMLATRIGQWVFRPFLRGEERIGRTVMAVYRESLIKALMFAGFSCIIGTFACAPVAIQSLNVKSVAGEVATYLVFMIVFASLSQALLRGDEKILLTCLAYAALMATVMKQGE
ncbi:hypothetical protein BHE90_008599 [Fusarium euwallaceae]|uniref:Uncharacterized protein n=2 Tax=Fusarium solani species complex TaxID=232080 RepID=A0A430LMN7_9HYPO|nr:hypothetical protein CEP51_011104 [Fusarium floridanum]RTE76920.1 hypothetical protein BHE90_008599 [Fusarium euwallaceae]